MTLVEDAFQELLAEFGTEFVHIPHGGYESEDDFWHEEQEPVYDEQQTFTGVMVSTEEQADLSEAGFMEGADFAIRTDYSELENGDIVVHRDEEYVVGEMDTREIQGREFAYRVGLSSSER